MNSFFAELDKLASVGSYYIAAAALVVSIATFVLAIVALYGTVRAFAEQKRTEIAKREDEIRQRRNSEAFDIFKILTGIKDFREGSDGKVVMTAHQSAALIALRDYPEFRDALLVQKRYWDFAPVSVHSVWMREQIGATIQYWETNHLDALKKHSMINYEEISNLCETLEEKQ